MIEETSNQQIIQLSIASKPDTTLKNISILPSSLNNQYNIQPSFSNQIQHDKGHNPYGFNTQTTKDAKTLQMSDFSLIIQQGLQNARRQSQQQTAISQLITQHNKNQQILIEQTKQMQQIVKQIILQQQQNEISQRVQKLLNEFQKLKEKFGIKKICHNKKGRIFSPSNNFNLVSNKKKIQQAYYIRKNKQFKRNSKNLNLQNTTTRGSNVTKRSTSTRVNQRKSVDKLDSIRTKETIQKQKQLLRNRIFIIKDTIGMTISSNLYKEQKLNCENNILRQQIKVTDNQIYDYHRKLFKKDNINYGSKNLKKLAKQKSLKLRKCSLVGKSNSKNNLLSAQSLSKKKLRIRSFYDKKQYISPKKQRNKCLNIRQQYFDKEKVMKRTKNLGIPSVRTQYY